MKWTVIWLPPIDGGDLEDSRIVLDKFKGVYIWIHKPTDQVLYIGEAGRNKRNFYERVVKEEVNWLKNGNWNIYDFDKEPDFGKMLRRYLDWQKARDPEVNKEEVVYIPNVSNSPPEVWSSCWQSKVDDYINNLQFLFCTGEWSSDETKRLYIERLLLWKYKRFYAQSPDLEKDNRRISIGKVDKQVPQDITFNHIGCVESVPKMVRDALPPSLD